VHVRPLLDTQLLLPCFEANSIYKTAAGGWKVLEGCWADLTASQRCLSLPAEHALSTRLMQ